MIIIDFSTGDSHICRYAMQDFSILICLILSMASSGSSNVALNGRTTTFNVLDFGAIGDGVTDDSQVSSRSPQLAMHYN